MTIMSFRRCCRCWTRPTRGISVFAASGAVLAAAKRQTFVTFIFFAMVAGVGGGTFRDLLIGVDVFWLHENRSLLICLLGATVVWLTPARIWSGRALAWLDAVGLAAYATYGAAKALGAGVEPVPAFAPERFSFTRNRSVPCGRGFSSRCMIPCSSKPL